MEKFNDIYQRAVTRKGSEEMLLALLSDPLDSADIAKMHDDLWLEELTRKVFQSGFYWSVINSKWSGFREVFWDFSVEKLLMMPPDMLEQKASDERIIRNFKKVQTIPENAYMIHEVAEKHGSFSQFVADWPVNNIIGLWAYLKKHGARLGGNTGPYALRAMGKDTFLLSRDVENYLRAHELIDGGLQTKKSLQAAQDFFNELQQQSGFSLQALSQLVAYGVGDNRVGIAAR
ncbi:3-methyladenine DNA glycosylase [Pseudoalteromonas sp. MEBiC 03607]|jgi:3-methyladenine DNA glycosylase Tag|uniref:DNA-3-methyladenine glycosylase I n=1 Tax=Pseudoalteromonas TaxID=53246 RepID=UPI000EE0A01C|nr:MULTISPECIES: DNA-3-methyladenine glycosylase I [unclassified Pseudoalteromonas]MEC8207669.1 DNA-3-methyladenine glycosylase I [Pseudomonadota bacterium]HCV03082.1 3-methyladenine DNA glycosylase [Pseudoalteromonas sp.]MCF2903143.1 DNA-3-methyladenine glycosylase I [Pseudoalteromonas sp. OFAV1]MCF2920990.1 DNA-3-methyladenine glycosylase I [Pseudoalteromonas sp. APAL1]MCO7249440.1 DNA-3-methyladenine glycosylase I [Pseudoalteromonas sp. Ps84H-4]|tara:strand:- start:2280 stop:2975 length:696 start_codon:yes stop_codon:yes gene_type:complete